MSRRRTLQPITSLLKQQVFPSETPITSGAAGARQYVTRFKMSKVGSILSGSQSALIVNFQTVTRPGIVCLTGLLNCLQRCNIYIGSHRVVSIQEAGKYLNHKLRLSMTQDEFVDKCVYTYGVNDKTRLFQGIAAGGVAVTGSNLFPRLEPSNQIFTSAARATSSYQLQLPLNFVFDLLDSDFPVYLLGSSDLYLEFAFDLTLLKNLLDTTGGAVGLPTDLTITNSFVYGVYYQLPIEALQRNASLPFTDVFYVSSLINGQKTATQSFSLNGQKTKRLLMLASKSSADQFQAALGDYASTFIDNTGAPLELQLKYLDEQYWTENILTDTIAFNYTNDCGKFGFLCQMGQFTFVDGAYLSAGNIPQTVIGYDDTVQGGLNMMCVNFGKVPYSHPLIERPEMQSVTMDNQPVQVLLRVQDAANSMNDITLHTHAELMKQLVLGIGTGIVVN